MLGLQVLAQIVEHGVDDEVAHQAHPRWLKVLLVNGGDTNHPKHNSSHLYARPKPNQGRTESSHEIRTRFPPPSSPSTSSNLISPRWSCTW